MVLHGHLATGDTTMRALATIAVFIVSSTSAGGMSPEDEEAQGAVLRLGLAAMCDKRLGMPDMFQMALSQAAEALMAAGRADKVKELRSAVADVAADSPDPDEAFDLINPVMCGRIDQVLRDRAASSGGD